MKEMEAVRSLLDRKVYRVSAVSRGMAVLRPIGEGDPILENLGDLETFYRKESVYRDGS